MSEDLSETTETPRVDTAPDTAEQMQRLWEDPPGLKGKLMAVQNDAIGKRLLFVGFFFLLLGGSVDSLAMRLQLAVPENDLISPELYNELVTNHGSVTMFLVILPITEGFAILMLPFLLGTREMPFPRLGAYSFFTYLMGGLFYYSSTLFQRVPDAGWTAYTPLSLVDFSPDLSLDFWVLGLSVAEVAAIAAGIEIIISILKFRAPGMSLARMPLFAWAMLVTAFMIVFAFTTLVVGSLLLELSRSYTMKFFDVATGGSSLLVAAPVLDLRPPRGVHPVPARRRGGVDDPARLRAAQDRRLPVARRRLRVHRVHVLRPVGAPHVRRRPAADRVELLLRGEHRHRRAGGHPDLRLAGHDVGRATGVEDAAAVRRRLHRHVRDRRDHRDHGRLGAARPAGP